MGRLLAWLPMKYGKLLLAQRFGKLSLGFLLVFFLPILFYELTLFFLGHSFEPSCYLLESNTSLPLLLPHKGVTTNAPPNSFAAIKEAVTRGYQMVEVDVVHLRSGAFALFHDWKTLDGTGTEGTREIAALHFKDTSHPISLLPEVLQAFCNTSGFYLDCKVAPDDYVAFSRDLLTLLGNSWCLQPIWIGSFVGSAWFLNRVYHDRVAHQYELSGQSSDFRRWHPILYYFSSGFQAMSALRSGYWQWVANSSLVDVRFALHTEELAQSIQKRGYCYGLYHIEREKVSTGLTANFFTPYVRTR